MTDQPTDRGWTSDPRVPTPANDGLTADHPGWKTTALELCYDGKFARVFHETVQTPSRPEGVPWTVVRRKPAVVMAARTVAGNWLMIRQERIPIRRAIWEFPAGQIEAGEGDYQQQIEATVWRELREETGWTAGPATTLTPLGFFFPSAGFTDELGHLFLADQLEPHENGRKPDEAESILECREFSSAGLIAMIATGEIRDANTLATFARLVALGHLQV